MVFERLRAELSLDSSGFRGGVQSAQKDMDSLSGRAASMGKSMQRAGAGLTAGLTAPLVAMGAGAANAAADFDASMQQSIAVMGDVSDAMREDLENTAREVATSMSVSHGEAAESFYFLASAGLDAAESMEAMPQVAAFAEAGQMDMAQATDVATNVMSAFGYEASEMAEVTDTLTATVTSHNQTMEGMADAMSYVAPTASGLGAEIEEVSAAIGLLGDVGLQGRRAGTALNTVLSLMADSSGPAAQGMEEMGVSVRNSEGEMRSFIEIIRDFEEAGATAGDMAELFGTRGGPAMSALLAQGSDALEESSSSIREMEGVTEDVANTQRDTLNAQLGILKSNIREVGIVIGENLLPVLNGLVERLMPVAEWFQSLSDRQQTLIIGIGALAAALGPVLLVVGTLLTLLPAMATGLGMVTAASLPLTAPILLAAGAVALLAAAFATDFLGIRTLVMETVSSIKTAITPLISLLRDDLEETLTHLSGVWEKHGEKIMEFVDLYLLPTRVAFEVAFAYIQLVVESVMDYIITFIRVALALLRGDFEEAFDLILGFLDRQLGRFKDFGKALIDTFAEGIKDAASAPIDAVKGIAEDVRSYLPFSDAEKGPFSDLTASGAAIPKTLAEGIESNSGELESSFEGLSEGGIDNYTVSTSNRTEGIDYPTSSPSTPSLDGGMDFPTPSTGSDRGKSMKQVVAQLRALRNSLENMVLRVETGDETLDQVIREEATVVIEQNETQKYDDFTA